MRDYRPRSTPTSPNLAQTQRWLRDEMFSLQESIDSIRDEFILQLGYGSIGSDGNTALGTVGTAWVTYPGNNAQRIQPVKTAYDLPLGELALLRYGVWRFNVMMSITFDAITPRGRNIYVRIYNDTAGVPSPNSIVFAVGRDADAVTVAVSWLVNVGPKAENQYLVPQISGSENFTNLVVGGSVLEATLISPYVQGAVTTALNPAGVP